jgi:hypothetical protein
MSVSKLHFFTTIQTTAPPSLPDIRRYDSSKSKTAQMSSPAEPVTFVGDGCGCIRDTVEGYLIKDTVTV